MRNRMHGNADSGTRAIYRPEMTNEAVAFCTTCNQQRPFKSDTNGVFHCMGCAARPTMPKAKKRSYDEAIFFGVVAVAGVIGIAWCSSGDDDSKKRDVPPIPVSAYHLNDPAPTPSISPAPAEESSEVAPTFAPGEDMDNKPANIAKADAAELAVYERCSKHAVFREGSSLDGTYVPPMGKRKFELVNVSVKLAHPEKADGNVLWYEVDFENGKPSTITGQKEISSQMCGLVHGQPNPL